MDNVVEKKKKKAFHLFPSFLSTNLSEIAKPPKIYEPSQAGEKPSQAYTENDTFYGRNPR